MFDNILHIIGNGFDLRHGIPSSYASYQEWLKRHIYDLYVTSEQTCTVEFLWSEFERALSYINRVYFLEHGKIILPEIEMLTEGAETFLNESKKPVDEIISSHQDFFDNLYDIEYIYILGHSISDVDIPYLHAVVQANDYPEQMKWYVSYYSPNEEKGYTIYQSIADQKSLIKSFKLSDIQIKRD